MPHENGKFQGARAGQHQKLPRGLHQNTKGPRIPKQGRLAGPSQGNAARKPSLHAQLPLLSGARNDEVMLGIVTSSKILPGLLETYETAASMLQLGSNRLALGDAKTKTVRYT